MAWKRSETQLFDMEHFPKYEPQSIYSKSQNEVWPIFQNMNIQSGHGSLQINMPI